MKISLEEEEEEKNSKNNIPQHFEIDIKNEDSKKEGDSKKYKNIIILMGITLIIVAILVISIIFFTNEYEDDKEEDDKSQITWDIAYEMAEEFIKKLNLTERVNLLFGTENMKASSKIIKNETEKEFLCVGQIDPFKNSKVDFKGICLEDGPAGVRFAKGSSVSWQASINTAATFNKTLMYEIGKAQGEENKYKGINVMLGPCANILRSPQGGRVWEAYGDDPYLTGICSTQVVKGIQDAGVIATLKHFVGNEQETYRKASSSNMDLSVLMDIYVEPFYRAIHDANLASIMTGYNALNNTYCAENHYLLTDILKKLLRFRGFVMSDWWGVYSNHSNTINSGLDMNMPGGYKENPTNSEHKYDNIGREHSFWTNLEEYVKEGIVTEERIKDAATRIIAAMYKMKQMKDYPSVDLYRETKTKEKIQLQRRAATESQVLLKNEGILPLKNQNIAKIAIIGNDAFEQDCGGAPDCKCRNETNEVFNGHIPLGYGSGTTDFSYLITPSEGIKKLCEKYNIETIESGKLIYTDIERDGNIVHINATEDIEGGINAANNSDVAIIFVSSTSGEEYIVVENTIGDRSDLNVFHNGNELIEKCAEVNENIIVVINSPSVVNIPWRDKVKAIIYSGFPGAESGNAIADVLFGEVNPSGHLPFVWGEYDDYPVKIEHLNNLTIYDKETGETWKDIFRYDGIDSSGLKDDAPGHDIEQYNYTEGFYIGQRWFNKNKIKPIFPFGHGLSYSTFEYNNLSLSIDKEGLKANFIITNNSTENGQAVPMMFITFPDNIGEYPKHIFKGFEKLQISPGESKNVTIIADDHALSYFNILKNNYIRVVSGIIKVSIAENGDPEHILLSGEIDAKY